MSLYKIHLYWRDHTPNEVVEATEDEIRHLLHVGLAEPVKEADANVESDAGRRSDGDDVSTESDQQSDSTG